jgi:hypothetical protein
MSCGCVLFKPEYGCDWERVSILYVGKLSAAAYCYMFLETENCLRGCVCKNVVVFNAVYDVVHGAVHDSLPYVCLMNPATISTGGAGQLKNIPALLTIMEYTICALGHPLPGIVQNVMGHSNVFPLHLKYATTAIASNITSPLWVPK